MGWRWDEGGGGDLRMHFVQLASKQTEPFPHAAQHTYISHVSTVCTTQKLPPECTSTYT